MWRMACVWSSFALLPMAALLLWHGEQVGWLYAAAAGIAFLYHWFEQRRFSVLDHTIAWACIVANCWLAWRTQSVLTTLAGVVAIGLALDSYSAAHKPPPDYGLFLPSYASDHYDRHHTVWHLWCGVAGLLLAWGVV